MKSQSADSSIEELIYAYFQGDINEAGKKQLAEWLAADPVHAKMWDIYSERWAIAASPFFMEKEKEDFDTRFASLVRTGGTTRRRLNGWQWYSVASTVLLCLTIGVALYSGKIKEEPAVAVQSTTEGPARICTSPGSRTEAVLPDGTHVWLNSATKLSFVYDREQGMRKASLDGEAYFEVKQDTLRPFIVQTKELSVKVLGTKFNVKAYSGDDLENVSLLSGRVNVSVDRDRSTEYMLLPHNQLNLDVEARNVELHSFLGTEAIAWIEGGYGFTNLKFHQIVKDLERKYGVEIILKSRRLANQTFSGFFPDGYTLTQIFSEMDVERRHVWFKQNNRWIIREK